MSDQPNELGRWIELHNRHGAQTKRDLYYECSCGATYWPAAVVLRAPPVPEAPLPSAPLEDRLRRDAGQILFEMHQETHQHAVRDLLWQAAGELFHLRQALAESQNQIAAWEADALGWDERFERQEAQLAESQQALAEANERSHRYVDEIGRLEDEAAQQLEAAQQERDTLRARVTELEGAFGRVAAKLCGDPRLDEPKHDDIARAALASSRPPQ